MTIWKLKSCPRCKGDVFIEKETDSWYARCLQCGNQLYLPSDYQSYLNRTREKEKTLIK
ncbi:MAG: Lar family restriction alleviation protein [Dehalococcoidales bacterium]